MSTQEKTKVYQKLLTAHDTLYDALEDLGEIKSRGEQMDRLTALFDKLMGVEALLDAANGSSMWKGDK